MAKQKKQTPTINTTTVQVLETFTGQINNTAYSFKKDEIVEMTKGELEVFGPRVKEM
jgi:hypothetical protein